MQKRFIAAPSCRIVAMLLALAACLAAGVPGCGGGGDGTTVLRVVVWKANNPEAWDEALALFQREHPGLRVELEIGPNSSTQLHDLITQKLRAGDRSLDAFLMDVVWPAEFAAAGWALPLDRWVTPAERAAFFPACIEAATWGDSLYGLPFNTDGGLLYYRADLLGAHGLAPPESWEDLVQQAQVVLAGPDAEGMVGYSGQFQQYEGLVCNMLEFVDADGGNLMQPAAPRTMEAVRFVQQQIIGRLAPRGVLTYEEQESLDLFRSGGAIFMRNWPYAWAIVNDSLQSQVAGKTGLVRLPKFPGGTHSAALGGWSFGIHRRSRHPEAALEFVRFMTGPRMQRHFAVLSGKAPARPALYDDPEVLEANPHFAALRPVFEAAEPRPRTPIYPQISRILQLYFHDAISDSAADVEALARQARLRIDEALEKAGTGGGGAAGAGDPGAESSPEASAR